MADTAFIGPTEDPLARVRRWEAGKPAIIQQLREEEAALVKRLQAVRSALTQLDPPSHDTEKIRRLFENRGGCRVGSR